MNEGMIHRRQTMHSAGFRDTGGMIRRHHCFEFDVNNTQVISGKFSTVHETHTAAQTKHGRMIMAAQATEM